MDHLATKDQLLARILAGRSAFYDTVRALDAARLGQPGVQGLWSVKDIVMHVVAWEAMALTWLDQAARGETLTLPDWRNVDALNDGIYRQHRDLPWEEVEARFVRQGDALEQALSGVPERDLFSADRFPELVGRTLATLIAGDTYRHYATHLRAIETWLAEDSADPRVYYACPGPVTHPHGYKRMHEDLPKEIEGLVGTVQGLMLHIFWAERYGVSLSEERSQEVNLRLLTRMLARIRALDARPLNEPRDLAHRLVGNCRDFTVLLVAMLRHQGIPARARCGFGAYFMPGHFEDHWVAEYWNGDQGRWVLVDGQIDAFQREQLQLVFDPLDVPRDQFIVAGQAWQMCREGRADPETFGIHDMHGWDFIRGNLIRDLLALNKVEILPWDWGLCYLNDQPFTDLALADRWAALTTSGDAALGDTALGDTAFKELRALYRSEPNLRVPAQWLGES